MNKIWRCPKCEAGVRAPERLRKIDVRRFCLDCSAKTGVLVERTIPSRDAERERTKLLRKEHEVKAREKQAAKRAAYAQTERGQLEAFARMALKLDAFETVHGSALPFQIRLAGVRPAVTQDTVTYGGYRPVMSTGHAYGKRRFVVTAGTDPYDAFQWERVGYFVADSVDSKPGAPVFNRTVTLRDTWGKEQARQS